MLYQLIFCFGLLISQSYGNLPYESCLDSENDNIKIVDLQVEGCDGTTDCTFHMTQPKNVTVVWETVQTSISSLKPMAQVKFFGFTYDVVPEPSDVCQAVKCPIQQSSQTTFTTSITLPNTFVTSLSTMRWSGKIAEEEVICLSFQIKIDN